MKTIKTLTTFLLLFIFIPGCMAPKEIQTKEAKIGNKTIKTVIIGDQEWMTENLDVATFANGDEILHAKTAKEWTDAGDMGTPAWCYYNNDPKIGEAHGKLYNWHAVADERGLAPKGWKIPNDEEWELAIKKIGSKTNAGYRMKSKEGWLGDGNGIDTWGLNVFPAGGRYNDGTFSSYGSSAFFWSASDHLMFYGRYFSVYHNKKTIEHNSLDKNYGFSIRCIKTNTAE